LIIACLYKSERYLRIINFNIKSYTDVKAHNNATNFIALIFDGKLYATVSSKGKKIQIYNSTTGRLLQKLWRGTSKTTIHSLAFDKSAN